jgi:hypothetical protein
VGKARPANPSPSPPPAALAGVYNNPYWGAATVSEAGDTLGLQIGPRGDVWPLTHWDGNVYTFSMVSENSTPGSISKATFDGNRLILEYYDDHHDGVFVK